MPRSAAAAPKSRLDRIKALPWAVVLQVGAVLGTRWWALPEGDRARIGQLLRESRGWPPNLSAKQRKELRGILDRFDLRGVGSELLPLARRGGARHKRR